VPDSGSEAIAFGRIESGSDSKAFSFVAGTDDSATKTFNFGSTELPIVDKIDTSCA
jgi:hypothetical protein